MKKKPTININKLMKPHYIIIIPVIISITFWFLPEGNFSAYRDKESINIFTIMAFVVWYGLISISAYIGYVLSLNRKRPIWVYDVDDRMFYYIITIVSFLGVTHSYITILRNLNTNLINIILNFQVNYLKLALYNDYNFIFHSFRYLSVIGCSLAICYSIIEKRLKFHHILNIIGFLLTILISWRLGLVLFFICFVGICSKKITNFLTIKKFIVCIILFFIIIMTLTVTRTMSTYLYSWGISNPIIITYCEIKRYLSAPAQASLAICNLWVEGKEPDWKIESFSKEYIVPTFLQNDSNDANFIWYHKYTNIDESLTTNSVVASMYSKIGSLSIFYMVIVVFILTYLLSVYKKCDNSMSLIYYVYLYALSEIWRVYVFNAGFLVILIVFVYLTGRLVRRSGFLVRFVRFWT